MFSKRTALRFFLAIKQKVTKARFDARSDTLDNKRGTIMTDYSVTLPSYTVGANSYSKISEICPPGRAALIGGKKALAAAEAKIRANLGDGITAGDAIWYGGEASEENISALMKNEQVKDCDMIFAVGGGKALDTCKALAYKLGLPVYSFPTIASTCAATTAVSILYHPDGSFSKPFFLPAPPKHAFIDTAIIATSPEKYLWAGMGDTLAKFYESRMSSEGEVLEHYHELGCTVSRMCVDPVLRWGEAALEQNRARAASYELEQVILAVTVTTGIASILLTNEHIIDYNTGLAHAVFYALTVYPEIEKNHLHGEVVAFGILLLLLTEGRTDEFDRLYSFMKSVALPTAPEDIGLTFEDALGVSAKVASMPDVDHNPFVVTEAMIADALHKLKEYNKSH